MENYLFIIKANLSKITPAIIFAVVILLAANSAAFPQAASCGEADYDCQIKTATKAILANPRDSESFYARANAYLNKEDYESAIKDYTRTLELDSEKYEVYNNRAAAYYNLKKYDAAIADYTKSIELDSSDPAIYVDRGNAYDDAGNFDAAIKDYNNAIKVNDKLYSEFNVSAYFNRGVASLNHGNSKQAVSDFQKVLQHQPENAQAKEFLAKAQTAKSEKDARTKEKWANFGKAIDQIANQMEQNSAKTSSRGSDSGGNTSDTAATGTNSGTFSGSSLPAGTYACFTTISIYAGRGGSGANTYPIYNSSRQTRGSIRVQSDGTYRLDDGTMLHYSFNGGAIRWLDGTFAEASSSNLQSDDAGKPQILIKFNGDKDVWDCTKQ